jgi:hypothetical protein
MRRICVRGLFALLLVGFVAQVVVMKVLTEPYPGLFQPGFGGFGGNQGRPEAMATVAQPVVTVTYANGSTATFSHRSVMERSKSGQLAVFESAFGADSPRHPDPQTVAWLEKRLIDLGGGRQPLRAIVSWRNVTYDLDTRQPHRIATTNTMVISFLDGGERG